MQYIFAKIPQNDIQKLYFRNRFLAICIDSYIHNQTVLFNLTKNFTFKSLKLHWWIHLVKIHFVKSLIRRNSLSLREKFIETVKWKIISVLLYYLLSLQDLPLRFFCASISTINLNLRSRWNLYSSDVQFIKLRCNYLVW